MPNPLSALASMGITTVEELQALTLLFSHHQRPTPPPYIVPGQPMANGRIQPPLYPAPTTPVNDIGQGQPSGKRNARTNYRS